MKSFFRKLPLGRKARRVAIGLAAVALFLYLYSWATYLFVIPIRPAVKPFATAYHDGAAPYILGDTFNCFFDTGWNISAVYADSVPRGFTPFRVSPARDASGESRFLVYYYGERFRFGPLRQSPMITYFFPREMLHYLPAAGNRENPYMVIGGTTIRGANWLLDTTRDSLYCLPYGEAPAGLELSDAAFALSFYSPWNRPLSMFADIEVDSVLVKGVLIDTGSSETLNIGKQAAEALGIRELAEISERHKATAYGIKEMTNWRYRMDSVRVGGHLFRDIPLNWGEEGRRADAKRLGYGFFKRFRRIFIDSEARKIYFFDDLDAMERTYYALWKRRYAGDRAALKPIRERVRQVREARGISAKEIAGETFIRCDRIERGNSFIAFATIRRLCDYLGITLAEFFEGVEGNALE